MADVTIVYQDPEALRPRARNPRRHPPKQIEQVIESIRRFGFLGALLVTDDGELIAGHARLIAAKRLGMTRVPTIIVTGLTDTEIIALVITLNKTCENAGWDNDILRLNFTDLEDAGFDVTITGFEQPEIDVIIGEISLDGETANNDPAIPPIPSIAVTRLGDVWIMGTLRLVCGDALRSETYILLLGSDLADMIFADPPYNVSICKHASGNGAIEHREFAMASGEMSRAQFTDFLTRVFKLMAAYSHDGAIVDICMDWAHMRETLEAGDAAFTELKNICCWTKSNAGMGALYRSQHELVLIFKSGRGPHINNIMLGRHSRNRSNVWSYPGMNTFGAQRGDLALHPTVKPVALVADAIRDCSHRGGLILDPFAGSGTTLLAAHKTGRRGAGIELDPLYCDVIVKRIQQSCGLNATLAATGQTFDEVAAERSLAHV